jgi:hypothetical protein
MVSETFPSLRMEKLFLLLGTFLLAVTARGSVIFFGSANIVIPDSHTGIFLNPLTGETTLAAPSSGATPWINPFSGGMYISTDTLLLPVIVGSSGSEGEVQIFNVPFGTLIDSSLTFAPPGPVGSVSHMGTDPSQFQANTPGYLGFRMQPGPTADLCYGWLEVSFNDTGAGIIHRYAYESTPNQGIAAGLFLPSSPVPEPGRGMLLMAGLAGMILRRRR